MFFYYIVVYSFVQRFYKNQKGITSIEYGLVGLAVATLVVAVLYGENNFINVLTDKFNALADLVISVILNKS
ncbi:Flp family type IVb pilin [Aggregatibacter kilianii]|jgi:flp2|uniref:Flp family type IVb pilin n=1 Tax=Aggregatibacter kilianii TaxID=2025884 RepID=UPI000D64388F|nr:Flp family type IVb pilin [Aggregatibacter kilianii]RDE85089.1 Flp family type IVb pilin [Aggregatibacter aphrophilus]RDE95941.1 Flp family type IVb pilin [Aggregatibacter aphrophilus]RDE97735.1 Flp family type IVb pilin [Aggregatibacter aphrophilus]